MSTINRENVSRLIVVSANVSGRDLGSVIKEVRDRVKSVRLPSGYYVELGGQFQAQEKATQTLIIAGLAAFAVISVLLYFAVMQEYELTKRQVEAALAYATDLGASHFCNKYYYSGL